MTKEPEYPMAIEYYKPLDLCVFALVNYIAIFKVKQSCAKKVIHHVASHRIDKKKEHLPTSVAVAQHKTTGRVLVIAALQTNKQHLPGQFHHYIVVYEFDQNNDYAVKELARIRSRITHVTAVRYHEEVGLIMGCFRGYIEVFDPITFKSVGRWFNQINPALENSTK